MPKITVIICSATYVAGTHQNDWLNTKIKVLGEKRTMNFYALKFKVKVNPFHSH